MARTGTSARKPKDDEHNWKTDIKKIFDVHQGPYLERWNSIFLISCVLAVSLDPLFFYVVNIDQKDKCLHTDKTLKIVALVLRSLTDVIFLVHLICEILDSVQKTMSVQKTTDKKSGTSASKMNTPKKKPSEEFEQTRGNSCNKGEDRELIQYATKIAQNVSWLSIIIDVFALLPFPQLIIIMFYPRENSGFVEHKKFLNVFLLGQYIPRIFRIHLSAKVFNKMNGIWAKGLFNLFLYILAGHVLGAFWYIFSIQRGASCLHEACGKLFHVCEGNFSVQCNDTLYCDSGNITERYIRQSFPLAARNTTKYLNESCPFNIGDDENTTAINIIKHLNESCPLTTPEDDLSPFNFGIFLDSLKNENPEKKFVNKFWYSFWWGLRNLSNFGTNLVTSTYVWENLFAILISITGLLLFIYLIGNVQAFMQMEATKTEDMRQQGIKTEEPTREATKTEDMRHQGIKTEEPTREATKTEDKRQGIKTEEPTKDEEMKRCLCMKILTKIPMLKDMDEKVLAMMCDYLKPVTYTENSFIFRTGDPLDCMLFIIEGTMWTYASSDSHVGQGISSMAMKPLRKGDFYGEELLDWASDCFTEVPVSSKHVKSRTKVEAFVLVAEDLETVVSQFRPPEEVEKVTLSAVLRFLTKAQRRPPPSPAEIGDDNNETLQSAASN